MDQDIIDIWEIEGELEEAIEIIKEIYNNMLGGFDSIQLGEDLYNRMESLIEKNE